MLIPFGRTNKEVEDVVKRRLFLLLSFLLLPVAGATGIGGSGARGGPSKPDCKECVVGSSLGGVASQQSHHIYVPTTVAERAESQGSLAKSFATSLTTSARTES